jgi:hypothetical protein
MVRMIPHCTQICAGSNAPLYLVQRHSPWLGGFRLAQQQIDGAAYWLGDAFERLQGRIVAPLVFIAVIALIAGALFVRQREAQLTIEAERAIPGSLELR